MRKNIAITILLFVLGCSGPKYQEIIVNKAVKVFSEEYHEQAENYIFKWHPPIGPNKQKMLFHLKNDMLIFTPEKEGKYEVKLSVEDISDEVVATKIFFFEAY